MATLWPVADNSTPWLMREFYQSRQSGEGLSKAEAFRRAQLALLNGTAEPSLCRRPRRVPRRPYQLALVEMAKTFVSASRDGTLKLWDTVSGNLLRTFAGHTSEVRSVAFSTNRKVILSGRLDGTMKLWSPNSDGPLATLISLDKTDWVVVAAGSRFDASAGAEKLLHFVANTADGDYKVIPLAELKSRHHAAGLLQKILQAGV